MSTPEESTVPSRRSGDKPRVGWVTLEAPSIGGGGGARRQHFLLERLHELFDVRVYTPNDGSHLRPTPAQRALSRLRGRTASPLARSTAFGRATLASLRAEGIDRLVIAHLETAAAVRDVLTAPDLRVVLDLHNVYSPFYERLGERRASRSWARLEAKLCTEASSLSVLSEEDAHVVRRYNEHMTMVPNGVSAAEWPARSAHTDGSGLAYFGSWHHRPNQIGLDWFLREVWPNVLRVRPQTVLHLYGPGDPVYAGAQRVAFHGRVDDLGQALASHSGIIVPIVEGVGTRVKFIEALASETPVASTTLGAQGYDMPEGMYLRADTPELFSAACVELLDRLPENRAMGVRAREFVLDKYEWRILADRLAGPLR